MQLPSLPWLASTLLVYVCCRAACHDGSISHALKSSNGACERPAAHDVVSTQVNLKLDSDCPEVLLVLDPNGIYLLGKGGVGHVHERYSPALVIPAERPSDHECS